MNYNPLKPIYTEKDLSTYETYIKSIRQPESKNAEIKDDKVCQKHLWDYLNNQIGKCIKAECVVGNNLTAKFGILLEVGKDFIIIRLKHSCSNTLIKLSDIKFISVTAKGNNRYKL